ncbi:hypothetical protein KC323_g6155 [Hortaea werneckii]|nr:hypothetical protein KC323_g6155 [Hortaea werneckii]
MGSRTSKPSSDGDAEKGQAGAGDAKAGHQASRPNQRTPVYDGAPVSEFAQQHGVSELEVFQTLVGIHFVRYGGGALPNRQKPPASVFKDIFLPGQAARARFRNRGLYDRTLSHDMKNRVLYGIARYIIIFLFLLQVVIAATVTALAADEGRTSNTALTALGAVNTVLAGILAWLNGQGMPTRFRRSRDKFREVVHAIENAERTFAEIDYIEWDEGTRPNPIQERDRLEKLYEEARLDMEANYPETQNGSGEQQAEARKLENKLLKNKNQKNKRDKEIAKLREKTELLEGDSKELKELKLEKEKLRNELERIKEKGEQFGEKALDAFAGVKERLEQAGESSEDGSLDSKKE